MMNLNTFSRWMIPFLLATLILVSCSPAASPTSLSVPQASATQNIQTGSESTPTIRPTLEVVPGTTASGSGPSCTVLQDLNLRFGPGTAYRPPVKVLPANS